MKFYLLLFLTIPHLTSYAQDNPAKKTIKKMVRVVEYYEDNQIKEKGKKTYQTRWYPRGEGRYNVVGNYFKQGKWVEYYINGNKKRIVFYHQGSIVREGKKWNEDGTRDKTIAP